MTVHEPSRSTADVLLVEDSPEDIFLMRKLLQGAGDRLRLHVVNDGVKAMQFLRGEGAYKDAPRPDLVLLDLNLPRKNGHEVLREMKDIPELRPIPVVMLTTSRAEEDVLKAYELQATSFIAKSVDLDHFIKVVNALLYYWLDVVQLPPRAERLD